METNSDPKIRFGECYSENLVEPSVVKVLQKDQQVYYSTKGNLTNGHWLLNPEFIPNNLKKRLEKHKLIKYDSCPQETNLWSTQTSNLKYLFTILPPMSGKAPCAIFRNSTGKIVTFNAEYVSYFSHWIKNFRLQADIKEPQMLPTVIYSGDQKIGLLMPYLMGNLFDGLCI